MTTINKLTRVDRVQAGDVLPVFVQNQGDARGASMTVIAEFIQDNLVLEDTDFITQYALPPANNFVVQIASLSQNTMLILAPTGAFAAGTIVLPPATTLIDGQEILVVISQALASLAVTSVGASIVGAPTSLAANQAFRFRYEAASTNWYVISNSVQAPLSSGGPLGTPSSGDLSNCVNLPIDTGVSGLAAGIAAFLNAPTSANLIAAVTDETGTGSLVFGTRPTLTAPTINAPSYGAPSTRAASFTLGNTDTWIICNGAASITVTLPTPASWVGRTVRLKNIQAFPVISSANNIVPLVGGAPSNAILPATVGATVALVCDGTNWVIME